MRTDEIFESLLSQYDLDGIRVINNSTLSFIDPYDTYESLTLNQAINEDSCFFGIGTIKLESNMEMWKTRAVKKKQKTKEMLEMAKVYKKSSSLYEFLCDIDLLQFKYVSTRMLTNPFVIYTVFSQKRIDKAVTIAFPTLIFAIGMVSWLASSIIVKLICVSIQFSLMSLQIWIYLQINKARHALSEVEILEIEEMFKAKH